MPGLCCVLLCIELCTSFCRLPAFKENLTKQIEVEKAKKERLEKQVDAVEKSVKTLQEKGTTCLKAKLSQLGITGKRSIALSTI